MDVFYLAVLAGVFIVTIGLVYGLESLKGGRMSWIHLLGAVLALGIFVYLVFALLYPEKF